MRSQNSRDAFGNAPTGCGTSMTHLIPHVVAPRLRTASPAEADGSWSIVKDPSPRLAPNQIGLNLTRES